MNIDSKYRLYGAPPELQVLEAYDFVDEPILLLEGDVIGNSYLSYLANVNDENETRLYIQVSKERLFEIKSNEISVHDAFSLAENNQVFITIFSLSNGTPIESYLVPRHDFTFINPIPSNYEINFEQTYISAEIDNAELLNYSVRKNKLVFDIYVQSKSLISNIKPWAFYKVMMPTVEMIKSLLGFDNRNADKYLAFSNFRHGSLGVTIEVNFSKDLFLEKESDALEMIIALLNSKDKEDFHKAISRCKNERYIKEYITIIKSIIDNDASLYTAYANPISKIVLTSKIDKSAAEKAKEVIDETLDVLEDIEIFLGKFLEIDIDSKEPSFKFYSEIEEHTVKGKFEASIIEKVKQDYVNIGKDNYKFTIKTIYQPETTLKSEDIKRYLINYEKA